jgi:fermentation-respiration switch protein FrsA (DUF1100 family)
MKGRRRVILKASLIALLVLVILFAGSGLALFAAVGNVRGSCGAHAANRPDRILFDDGWPPIDLPRYAMPGYQTVRFPSRDPGIEIAGWWIPKDPGAPAVILVDGLGGCKNSIAVLVPAGMLWRNGFNVLLIDLRDTGDSTFEDGRSTIGNEEYRDVLGAWDWLVNEKGFDPKRIGLFANSLGGANANYAFSEEPRIAALFLQSTFGNLQQVIAAELKRNGYPTFLAPAALVSGSVVTGANLFGHNPLDAIRKATGRPVYVVHTRADTRIDVNQSEQLAAAAEAAGANVTTWFPESGEHVQTPALYPEEFEERLVEFFHQTLGQ